MVDVTTNATVHNSEEGQQNIIDPQIRALRRCELFRQRVAADAISMVLPLAARSLIPYDRGVPQHAAARARIREIQPAALPVKAIRKAATMRCRRHAFYSRSVSNAGRGASRTFSEVAIAESTANAWFLVVIAARRGEYAAVPRQKCRIQERSACSTGMPLFRPQDRGTVVCQHAQL